MSMTSAVGLLLALVSQTAAPPDSPVEPATSVSTQPKMARFSFYPIRLYDLSPQAGVFSADFYFWLSLPKKPIVKTISNSESAAAPPPKIESANGEELECEVVEYDPPTSQDTQTFWYRCRSRFYHSFNFAFYPFDEQRLTIRLESPEYSKADFAFEVMRSASHIGECPDASCLLKSDAYPSVSGWEVSSATVHSDLHTYATDWGFASYKSLRDYSQAVLEIRLLHRPAVPLLALIGPNILVFLLALFLAGSDQERMGRMQALLGVIAAAATQHYAFMSNAPGESILSFAQGYFLITYALIGLASWFILTRDQPLPRTYQWRWFAVYAVLTGGFFGFHRTMATLAGVLSTR
jgi:hypothetical protein